MAGGGGQVVAGHAMQNAQLGERVSLAGPIPGLARRDQGGLVEGGGLIPVTVSAQKPAHRGGDGDRMLGPPARRGVLDGRVQIGTLGFEPVGRP